MNDLLTGFYGSGVRSSAPAAKPKGYDPTYGGIPQLPKYATDTNTTVGTDVQAEMLKNLPGYQAMASKDTANIQANLGGYLAPDVLTMIQQQAAERGVATGGPGSANTDAAYLRALGLTSLQLQQLGHQQLTEAMQRTPIQQRQTVTSQRDLAPMQAVYDAAPVPALAHAQALMDAQTGYSAGYRGGGIGGYGGYTINPSAGGSSGAAWAAANQTPFTDYGAGNNNKWYYSSVPNASSAGQQPTYNAGYTAAPSSSPSSSTSYTSISKSPTSGKNLVPSLSNWIGSQEGYDDLVLQAAIDPYQYWLDTGDDSVWKGM